MTLPFLREDEFQVIGPNTACQILLLFWERKLELSEDDFEMLCDRLYFLIEELRNERYRLIKP